MCDHYECEHLGNKPAPASLDVDGLRADLTLLLRENLNPTQSALNTILVKNGLPAGSIIVVDDRRTPLAIEDVFTPEVIASLTPRTLDVPSLESNGLDLLTWSDQVPEPPENLEIRNWEIEYLETDCGRACTPDGCRGHTTDIPVAITIGQNRIRFTDDVESTVEGNNLAAIGRYIVGLIKAAQARRAEAEAIATQIEAGAVDLGAKTLVRGREAMLQKIEEGYRLFGDISNPGIKFLRASGKPDLLYYDV